MSASDRQMLQRMDLGQVSLDRYEPIVGRKTLVELSELAAPLRGARVAQINATAVGNGVTTLLRSLVPLYRALDVEAEWLTIPGGPEFFSVAQGIHDAFQGAEFDLTAEAKAAFINCGEMRERALEESYDYVIVHDPPAIGLSSLRERDKASWVWRCHVDASECNQEVLAFLKPFIDDYDRLVFPMDAFVPEQLRDRQIVFTPPGIDPLSPKNVKLRVDLCRQILEWTGVRLDKLLITHVSRFDTWKDPSGVIDVYRQVRAEVPGTQLALLGQMPVDDPRGWEVYREIVAETRGDPEMHVLTNCAGVGNVQVNAFQSSSQVVLQKSIREGFGLAVSEALWKGTPVVAGRAGGIPLQMPEGTGGYLVDSTSDCVEKTLRLLRNPREADELAVAGRAHVKRNFLITRVLADELRLLASLP